MKQLLLTGVSQNMDLRDGSTGYYLVFNEGELLVPVGEEGAAIVLTYVSDGVPEAPPRQEEPEHPEGAEIFSSDEDDYSSPPSYEGPEGIEEVNDGVDQL